MNEYDAIEQAYDNGYEAGVKDLAATLVSSFDEEAEHDNKFIRFVIAESAYRVTMTHKHPSVNWGEDFAALNIADHPTEKGGEQKCQH